jgi:hypothetical protein
MQFNWLYIWNTQIVEFEHLKKHGKFCNLNCVFRIVRVLKIIEMTIPSFFFFISLSSLNVSEYWKLLRWLFPLSFYLSLFSQCLMSHFGDVAHSKKKYKNMSHVSQGTIHSSSILAWQKWKMKQNNPKMKKRGVTHTK